MVRNYCKILLIIPSIVFGQALEFPSQIPPADLLNDWRTSLQNSRNMPNEITQDEEIWDGDKGTWVSTQINPQIGVNDQSSDDFNNNPISDDNHFSNDISFDITEEFRDSNIQISITQNLEEVISAIKNGDQDDDNDNLQMINTSILNLNNQTWEIDNNQWDDISNLYQYFNETNRNDMANLLEDTNASLYNLVNIVDQNEISIGLSNDINQTLASTNTILQEFLLGYSDDNVTIEPVLVNPAQDILPLTVATYNQFLIKAKTAIGYDAFQSLDFQITPKDQSKWDIISIGGYDMGIDISDEELQPYLEIGKIGITLVMIWGLLIFFFRLNSSMLAS